MHIISHKLECFTIHVIIIKQLLELYISLKVLTNCKVITICIKLKLTSSRKVHDVVTKVLICSERCFKAFCRHECHSTTKLYYTIIKVCSSPNLFCTTEYCTGTKVQTCFVKVIVQCKHLVICKLHIIFEINTHAKHLWHIKVLTWSKSCTITKCVLSSKVNHTIIKVCSNSKFFCTMEYYTGTKLHSSSIEIIVFTRFKRLPICKYCVFTKCLTICKLHNSLELYSITKYLYVITKVLVTTKRS